MKLSYLLSFYPMASTTFIRREIEALEALGQPVSRISVRHWDIALVDPVDIAEKPAPTICSRAARAHFCAMHSLGCSPIRCAR